MPFRIFAVDNVKMSRSKCRARYCRGAVNLLAAKLDMSPDASGDTQAAGRRMPFSLYIDGISLRMRRPASTYLFHDAFDSSRAAGRRHMVTRIFGLSQQRQV